MRTLRIIATDEAVDLIIQLSMEYGLLMFQMNEFDEPVCTMDRKTKLNPNDVCVGEVAGCLFFMDKRKFERSKHTQLVLDVEKGKEKGLSLERALGLRFLVRSRPFTAEEQEELVEMEEDPELRMFSYIFGYGLQWL
ncbi:DUF779 domain-containing protein [Chitinophaga sp. SYP-B3965]|uniref:DUF779 domain-containing protein n=1 Tax=Chitinophaga sp. SYP-B3965 TaxID=2663120 RepID=UPI0012998120|nr:DUF779 domain-containing protein [Chitinophaga sp. SYP-B3965]MRG43808.1 DUF779 domain-containing protein [Chitinophaga sp. SYP-B3965]